MSVRRFRSIFDPASQACENNLGRGQLIDQQEITADVALLKPFPIAAQRMLQPFRTERSGIGDQKHHDFFSAIEIVFAGPVVTLPVFLERLGMGDFTRQRGPS
jgi:hypothetical protein